MSDTPITATLTIAPPGGFPVSCTATSLAPIAKAELIWKVDRHYRAVARAARGQAATERLEEGWRALQALHAHRLWEVGTYDLPTIYARLCITDAH